MCAQRPHPGRPPSPRCLPRQGVGRGRGRRREEREEAGAAAAHEHARQLRCGALPPDSPQRRPARRTLVQHAAALVDHREEDELHNVLQWWWRAVVSRGKEWKEWAWCGEGEAGGRAPAARLAGYQGRPRVQRTCGVILGGCAPSFSRPAPCSSWEAAGAGRRARNSCCALAVHRIPALAVPRTTDRAASSPPTPAARPPCATAPPAA